MTRESIALTALATTVPLLAGCKQPAENPVANDIAEPAADPAGNMVDAGNKTGNASTGPTEPTTDGGDDRVAGE